jgi:hypothetical protein
MGRPPEIDALKLEGKSIVELALNASQAPISMAEVEAYLKATDPPAFHVGNRVHLSLVDSAHRVLHSMKAWR